MSRVRAEDIDQLPQDLDAEKELIGSILIDPDAMIRAQEVGLEADDFFHEWYGRI